MIVLGSMLFSEGEMGLWGSVRAQFLGGIFGGVFTTAPYHAYGLDTDTFKSSAKDLFRFLLKLRYAGKCALNTGRGIVSPGSTARLLVCSSARDLASQLILKLRYAGKCSLGIQAEDVVSSESTACGLVPLRQWILPLRHCPLRPLAV